MKSVAPVSMALTAMSMSPCRQKNDRKSISRFFISSCSFRPLISAYGCPKSHIPEERIVFLQEFLSTVISGGSEASHIHQKGFEARTFSSSSTIRTTGVSLDDFIVKPF